MKQSPSFIPLPKYQLRIVKHYDKNYSFIKETRFVLVVDSLVTTTSDYTFYIDEIYRHKILLIFSPLYFLSRTFSYPQLSNESALRNICSRGNLSFYISPSEWLWFSTWQVFHVSLMWFFLPHSWLFRLSKQGHSRFGRRLLSVGYDRNDRAR